MTPRDRGSDMEPNEPGHAGVNAPSDTTVTIRVEPNTIWRIVGIILITLLTAWIIGQAANLLVMLAISFFFSLAMQPAVLRLTTRYGWKRGVAVGVIYLTGFVGVILMLLVLVPAMIDLARVIGDNASVWVANSIEWANDTLGTDISQTAGGSISGDEIDEAIVNWAQNGGLTDILGVATSGLSLIFNMATVAMFTFYFTADAARLKNTVLSLVKPENQYRIGWTWDQAVIQTGGYFYSRMLLMVINAFGFFFTMVVVGMPVTISIPLSLMAGFIAAFIPAIGTYIGSAIPIVVTLGIQGVVPALVILAYAIVYQQIENYWLSPKISSNTMTLNGAVAFGAALAGGAIAGPLGAFVALPVAALVTSLISNFATHYEVIYDADAYSPPAGSLGPQSDPGSELPEA